jgi:hypothetical protein
MMSELLLTLVQSAALHLRVEPLALLICPEIDASSSAWISGAAKRIGATLMKVSLYGVLWFFGVREPSLKLVISRVIGDLK